MNAIRSALAFGAAAVVSLLLISDPVHAGNEAEVGELLVKLLQAGRSVISAHQELINDASKGNKGFTAEYMGDKMIEKYREVTKIDLRQPNSTPYNKVLLALVDSGKEVIAEAQPVINKQGIGFKGMIPAVWGRKTGEKFAQKTGIRLKLTATDYRFPGNKPDDFEAEVLKMFADPSYPKGKEYSRTVMYEGRPALRMMTPEYAGATCLRCHGEPRGEKDITGNKKEGLREGGLAGAISLVIPIH
ncbi:Tll0287-like domain-containing protein [Candidatus Nitrospira bockiana]